MPDTATPPASVSSAPPFPRSIRVLVLEDRVADAELIVHELGRAGFMPDWHRAETRQDFLAHLHPDLDVILADYQLPQFDGLSALRQVQEQHLDIPFIIVSGMLSDVVAAQCIKSGVTDYLRKDNLDRLGLAVTNALEERRLRGERKAMQAQLLQAQKMEVIGQLAGGIAHDFNNILCVINGRAALLMEDPSLSPAVHDSLKEIYTAGARAAALTRQLLVFSRRHTIHRVPVDLNHAIEDLTKMLGRLIGENIHLVFAPAAQLPTVEADVGMIEQVLINLAVNARDAMPRGGTLAITTSVVEISPDDARDRPQSRAGRFVCLEFSDTGCGIAPQDLPRIFEPFFTTKSAGKGTGLGLSTVFGIVGQHQGWIDVSSVVNGGTTFKIHLPASERDEPSALLGTKAAPAVRGGNEMILVVEDEDPVREFAVAVLQQHGYRVLQARTGRDALECWQRHQEQIALVLTDVVLPDDVTGPEIAAAMQKGNPRLRVLFTSGYTPERMSELFAGTGGRQFLRKPYQPRHLAMMVRDAIDALET